MPAPLRLVEAQPADRLVLTVRVTWHPRVGMAGEWHAHAEAPGVDSAGAWDADREVARRRAVGRVLARVAYALDYGDRPAPAGIDIVDAPAEEP